MGGLCERGERCIRLTLPVAPRGQGRPRFVVTKAGPRAYTPAATRQAHDEIRTLWMLAGRPEVPHGVPFTAEVRATFARPASHVGVRGLTKAGRLSPLPRPDVDNIGKLVLDALQGHAFTDDLWCGELVVGKAWGDANRVEVVLAW